MATTETKQLDSIISSRRAMLALGGVALAGLAFAPKKAEAASYTDDDILNFALNLEYLEAQFYTLAASGQTIDQLSTPIGIGAGTSATGGGAVTTKSGGPAACKVPFTNTVIQAYAQEIALEEQKHVSFLRSALGSNAVAQPPLDLYNSFNTLGQALGLSSFDPFANDVFFLIGSYIFEDVGVTAYHGGAPLITDKTVVLPAAVGIHAVEAEHAGMVRMTLYHIDYGLVVVPGYTGSSLQTTLSGAFGTFPLHAITQKISTVRNTLDQVAYTDDYGLPGMSVALNTSTANITSAMVFDAPVNGIAASATGVTPVVAGNNNMPSQGYSRTPPQVISIVTAGGTTNSSGVTTGGFYPAGLNGFFQAGV